MARYGETVDFSALPASVQSEAMAEAVGALPVIALPDFEVCGSPGEAGNDPTLGNRFMLNAGNYYYSLNIYYSFAIN